MNLISTLIYSVFYCLVHNVCSFYSRFLLEELKYTERRQAYLGVQKISLISLQRLVKYTTMNLLLNLVYNVLYCLIHNVCSMCSPFLLVGLDCCASHLNSERQFKCNKKKKKSRFKSTRKQFKNRKQSLGLKLVFNDAMYSSILQVYRFWSLPVDQLDLAEDSAYNLGRNSRVCVCGGALTLTFFETLWSYCNLSISVWLPSTQENQMYQVPSILMLRTAEIYEWTLYLNTVPEHTHTHTLTQFHPHVFVFYIDLLWMSQSLDYLHFMCVSVYKTL